MSDKNLVATVPKSGRISFSSETKLKSLRSQAGFTDREAMEICVARQAIELMDAPKAKELLYNLLIHNVASTSAAALRQQISQADKSGETISKKASAARTFLKFTRISNASNELIQAIRARIGKSTAHGASTLTGEGEAIDISIDRHADFILAAVTQANQYLYNLLTQGLARVQPSELRGRLTEIRPPRGRRIQR